MNDHNIIIEPATSECHFETVKDSKQIIYFVLAYTETTNKQIGRVSQIR